MDDPADSFDLSIDELIRVSQDQTLLANRLFTYCDSTFVACFSSIVGSGAAYIFSAVAMLMPQVFAYAMRHDGKIDIYFEAAAVIVILVLLGQVPELRARSRTGSVIKELLNLALPTARKVVPGSDSVVPLDQVHGIFHYLLPAMNCVSLHGSGR